MDDVNNTTIRSAIATTVRYWTGRAVIAVGMRVRPWLDDEFAHGAMLLMIMWGWGRRGD